MENSNKSEVEYAEVDGVTEKQESPQDEDGKKCCGWKASLTTVTPFSRALALILFIALPIGSFFIGAEMAKETFKKGSMQEVYVSPGRDVGAPSDVPDQAAKLDDTAATAEGLAEVVKGNNAFALDLYKDLVKKEEGNIFFSPYSISSALAMTYEGARGETATEMVDVFGFNADDSVRRPAMAAVYNGLNKADAPYNLYTANALWVQKDYQLLPEYTDAVAKYYGGYATNVDFATETEKARLTINGWVEDNTEGKIENLIGEGVLGATTRLVLTNTIYFKGDWLAQFDADLTKNEDFAVSTDKKISVPMMMNVGEEAEYRYVETDGLQVLELPYKGEELSMLVLLPEVVQTDNLSENGLSMLEQNITVEALAKWNSQLREQRVDVYLPKFKVETKYNLNDLLKTLGMPSAFDASVADFSGIGGNSNLSISAVIHQAFVEVNEEGTEAAAATAVVMAGNAAMPALAPVFRADRPFLFVIQENKTGNILFMGKIANPVSK